jgi:hypothetical protein
MIFNDRPMIGFGARKIANKMITFLDLPCGSTAGTHSTSSYTKQSCPST